MREPQTLIESYPIPQGGERSAYRWLLLAAAFLFLFMPFITTFNEFLTALVMRLGGDLILRQWVAPVEARLIAVLLWPLGISASVSDQMLYLQAGSKTVSLFISWNCVGWQAFILFALSLVTGLQGSYSRRSKWETVAFGFLGTFLLNLLRIAVVALVAFHFGQLPAVIFHDYAGTLLIILWLFALWHFSHRFILVPLEEPEDWDEEPALA
ncbi:MAG: exosortase/archaeosortase family protein [Chloroflexi bacterium]|nr:exosortase/archaeosortase family protein [Chloroflexota bacterium]